MNRRNVLRALACVVLAGLALAAAGCGGGGSEPAAAETNAADAQLAAALEWSKCMRKQGVDVPDPQSGENGMVVVGPRPGDGTPPPESEMRRAGKKCDHILQESGPGAGAPELSPEEREKFREQALEFARCMREQGIDMPDPQFEGGGAVMQRIPEGAASPAFRRAEKKCSEAAGIPDGPTMEVPAG